LDPLRGLCVATAGISAARVDRRACPTVLHLWQWQSLLHQVRRVEPYRADECYTCGSDSHCCISLLSNAGASGRVRQPSARDQKRSGKGANWASTVGARATSNSPCRKDWTLLDAHSAAIGARGWMARGLPWMRRLQPAPGPARVIAMVRFEQKHWRREKTMANTPVTIVGANGHSTGTEVVVGSCSSPARRPWPSPG